MRTPKYTGIYETLIGEIRSGLYDSKRPFPSESELTKRFGVARETLRRALSLLEQKRVIVRTQGRRTLLTFYAKNLRKILYTAPASSAMEALFKKIGDENGIETFFVPLEYFRRLKLKEMAAFLADNNISDIVLSGCKFYSTESIFENLSSLNVPTVLIFANREDFRFNRLSGISFNLRSGWENALRHLAAQGCRRVATLALSQGGGIRDIPTDEYPDILKKSGLSDAPELIFHPRKFFDVKSINHPDEYYPEIFKEAVRMLKLNNPPDAFLCFNDYWVPPVYQAIAGAGKKIPDDIAVMGFMSDCNCDEFLPPLSSIQVDFKSVFQQAVSLLLAPPGKRTIIPMQQQLFIRQSTLRIQPE